MGLKRRFKSREHREGQAQRFLDAVQALINLKSRKDLFLPFKDDQDPLDGCRYNPKAVDEVMEILSELRSWDITEVGNLYFTSGGRIVLDKGYGEYFTEGDQMLFTKEQLHSGVRLKEFKAKIKVLRD